MHEKTDWGKKSRVVVKGREVFGYGLCECAYLPIFFYFLNGDLVINYFNRVFYLGSYLYRSVHFFLEQIFSLLLEGSSFSFGRTSCDSKHARLVVVLTAFSS